MVLVSVLHSLAFSYLSILILNLFVSFFLSSRHSGNLWVPRIVWAPFSPGPLHLLSLLCRFILSFLTQLTFLLPLDLLPADS